MPGYTIKQPNAEARSYAHDVAGAGLAAKGRCVRRGNWLTMFYRVYLSNYTASVDAETFEMLKSRIADPSSRWESMAVGDGKWIVPAHVIAVDAIAVVDMPPVVLSHAPDVE
jgi:hypothetical protein